LDKLSWGVRSALIDFSTIFDKLEIYIDKIETALLKEKAELDIRMEELIQISDIEIDFDSIPKPPQNWENVGSIESDETLEELLAALTK